MVIMLIIIVPVLLYLDQIHLLLLGITTTVNLAPPALLILIDTTHMMCYGMDIFAVMLIITAVPTLTCLGSSDNFHVPCRIILKKESAPMNHSIIKILLCKALNCTYSDIY